MLKTIRRKLTVLYSVSFFLLFLLFMTSLYFSMTKIMENQQIENLERYFEREKHDLWEHRHAERETVTFDPNRSYFYYVFDQNKNLVDGDEQFYGFHNDLIRHLSGDIAATKVFKLKWQGEYFILLQKPIRANHEPLGFMVLGQAITDQYLFMRRMLWFSIVLTVVFTCLLGVLSYYLAGKSMKPIEASFERQKRFVSDASHELRTPLSIFYSSLEILEEEEKHTLSPFGREIIGDLKAEAASMKRLLEDLLFLARHDQKEWKLKKERFNLSDVLLSTGRKFARTLPSNPAFSMNAEENLFIEGDRTRIEELLYILLDNAAKYTKKGKIILSLEAKESYAKITVRDTGIGIKKEDLPRIFDRFYRCDPARDRSGTGLGLSIAKTIVEMHQGHIQAESQEGKGTTFSVFLPLKK